MDGDEPLTRTEEGLTVEVASSQDVNVTQPLGSGSSSSSLSLLPSSAPIRGSLLAREESLSSRPSPCNSPSVMSNTEHRRSHVRPRMSLASDAMSEGKGSLSVVESLRRSFWGLALTPRGSLYSPHGSYFGEGSESEGTRTPLRALRALGRILTGGVYDMYYCQICFEHQPAHRGYTIGSVRGSVVCPQGTRGGPSPGFGSGPGGTGSRCGHTYCRECLKAYLECKVSSGELSPVCFHMEPSPEEGGKEVACNVPIGEDAMESLLDEATFQKYKRFQFAKEHENARNCPQCEHPQLGEAARPAMTCDKCGLHYCYAHSDAHTGTSCAEYEHSIAEVNKASAALISSIAKKCPGCQNPVEKSGGCNQMKCFVCSTNFCWICGQKVDDGTFPAHFQWWNVGGCPNQQMGASDEEGVGGGSNRAETSPGCQVVLRVLALLQLIVLGPFALACTVAWGTLCCCVLPAFKLPPRELFSGCISMWGYVLLGVVLAPPILAVGLIYGFLCLFVWLGGLWSKGKGDTQADGSAAADGAAGGAESEGGGVEGGEASAGAGPTDDEAKTEDAEDGEVEVEMIDMEEGREQVGKPPPA